MRRNLLLLLGMAVIASSATAQSGSSKKSTPAKKTAAAKKSSTAKKSSAAAKGAAASSAGPRVEAPWRVAYSDAKLLVTLDTSQSDRLPDGTYRTRMRWKYTGDQKIEGNKTYRTMVEYRLLECKRVRSKPLRATAYDVDGNPVSSFSTPDDEIQYLMWSKRNPGTANDKALVKACQLLATRKA